MSKEEKDWDAEYAPEVAKRQNDVKGLLAKKDKKAALKACLVNPPVQSKNAQLKVGESGSRRNQNDRVAVLGTRRSGWIVLYLDATLIIRSLPLSFQTHRMITWK